MFRLFFVIVSLKTPLLLISFRKSLQKFPYHKKKSPLASRQTLGHRLCSAKAVCFPDFQPENIKKNKTPIWGNNSPFQTDKTPSRFAETAFCSTWFADIYKHDYLFHLWCACFELGNIRKIIQQFLKKNLSLNNNFVSLWHQRWVLILNQTDMKTTKIFLLALLAFAGVDCFSQNYGEEYLERLCLPLSFLNL